MPAQSEAQRRLFSIAEHHPDALYAENRHLGKLGHQTLHEFAATKGLSKKPYHVKHKIGKRRMAT